MGRNYKVTGLRPTRDQLYDMSPSKFKSMLKQRGYKVPRNFYKVGSVARYKNRFYRFRWWSDEFFVDKSCVLSEFDRWANSVDMVITIFNWLEGVNE